MTDQKALKSTTDKTHLSDILNGGIQPLKSYFEILSMHDGEVNVHDVYLAGKGLVANLDRLLTDVSEAVTRDVGAIYIKGDDLAGRVDGAELTTPTTATPTKPKATKKPDQS